MVEKIIEKVPSKNNLKNTDIENQVVNTLVNQAKLAKEAAIILATLSNEKKNSALEEIAKQINLQKNEILDANKIDLELAEKNKLSKQLIKRLILDDDKIHEIINEINGVKNLPNPVGKTMNAIELDNGFELYQVTCPIGVIGAIFEARPDALVQISSLCFKSGNAVILKGGSEAINTNRILAKIISNITDKYAKGCVQLIETRQQVSQMLDLDKYIDLIIPRGSNSFVKYIQNNSKIPVLGHSEGICHIFVDKDADLKKALQICLDAKIQYPSACNTVETLLIHKNIVEKFLPKLILEYGKECVEIRGDLSCQKIAKDSNLKIKNADETDWKSEYGDLIISIKIVNDENEAIKHINNYGSKHTDAIITENDKTARNFLELVDTASAMWNCSTRFADGFRYGKGAEVGISTSKIHTRGPVGLEGLTIYKYILKGEGNLVKDYVGKNAKKYTHKKLNKKW